MRLHLAFLTAFSVLFFASAAAALTTTEVLRDCPDIPGATACTGLTQEFVDERAPGPRRDRQIVALATQIAEAASQPEVPLPACLDAAAGLRLLADGMSDAGQAQQIRDIADALCDGTQTAAINAGDDDGAGTGPLTGGGPGNGGGSSGDDDTSTPNDDDDTTTPNDDDDTSTPNDDDGDDDDTSDCAGNSQPNPGNSQNCSNNNNS